MQKYTDLQKLRWLLTLDPEFSDEFSDQPPSSFRVEVQCFRSFCQQRSQYSTYSQSTSLRMSPQTRTANQHPHLLIRWQMSASRPINWIQHTALSDLMALRQTMQVLRYFTYYDPVTCVLFEGCAVLPRNWSTGHMGELPGPSEGLPGGFFWFLVIGTIK